MTDAFAEILARSTAAHGHCCPGQVLGVRLALLGCRLAEIEDPQASRDLVVYVEIDRCLTDAIQSVTGCKLGKRTLKFLDYGKAAATFVNLKTGAAWRVAARAEARELALRYAPTGVSNAEGQSQAYQVMPDDELFTARPVRLAPPREDLPGRPKTRVVCQECREEISDNRQLTLDGRTLCRPCALGACWQPLNAAQPQPQATGVPVVGVVGYSDSGKTRVAAALVSGLTARGYSVGAIKHCVHGHQPGRASSDSVRLLAAGGVAVIASSPGLLTRSERTKGDTSLAELVSSLPPNLDIVIAEGFKTSPFPKIVVGEAPADVLSQTVIAFVDSRPLGAAPPSFSIENLEELLTQIEARFLRPVAALA